MSFELALLLVTFLVLVVVDAPIAVALGLASVVYLAVADLAPMMVVAQRMIAGIDSFTLLAIPLFLLAGMLMVKGGLAPRIVNLCSALVGHMTGGLAIVMIAACIRTVQALRGHNIINTEDPAKPSHLFAPNGLVASKAEKDLQAEWDEFYETHRELDLEHVHKEHA